MRKPNPAIHHLPLKAQRQLIARERRARRSGEWGDWEIIGAEGIFNGRGGWLDEVRRAHRNRVFAVLERPVGIVIHIAVSSLSGDRPSWREMQRIKDEIVGAAATAVEVYPPSAEVVDAADMYHIWVLPGDLPFSLFDDRHIGASRLPGMRKRAQ